MSFPNKDKINPNKISQLFDLDGEDDQEIEILITSLFQTIRKNINICFNKGKQVA